LATPDARARNESAATSQRQWSVVRDTQAVALAGGNAPGLSNLGSTATHRHPREDTLSYRVWNSDGEILPLTAPRRVSKTEHALFVNEHFADCRDVEFLGLR
jgi:hypothetical protein